ncbi:hypothetical protein PRNP1_012953 [Phytophthora ramorum]
MTSKANPISTHKRDIWAVEGVVHSIFFYLDPSSFDALLSVLQAIPELLGYLQDASLWASLSKLHFGGPRDLELQIDDGCIRDRDWDWTSRERTCAELQHFLQSADDQVSFNEAVAVIEGDIGSIDNIDGTPLDGIAFPTGSSLMNPHIGAAGAVFRRAGGGLDKLVNGRGFRRNGHRWLPAGSAVVTQAFEAGVDTLIHCVGPSVRVADCYELLARTYDRAMNAALREELQCVAMVSVSTGDLGVPCVKGARVALRTIQKFLVRGNWHGKLAIVCNDERVLEAFKNEKADVLSDFNVVPPCPVGDSGGR